MDKKENLVSVIIPCYNGENVVHRLLDSLLEQTYKKLEIVLVNDGSTDNTETVVKRYIPSFEEQDIAFKYVYQENKGLGGAINTGLANITGEFFIWPDADDMLTPDSVEKKLNVLLNNPEVPLVTSNAYITDSEDPYKPVKLLIEDGRNMESDNLFEDYILEKGPIIFCSGTHMMRREMFETANGSLNIYPARRGQNWQLLLPVLYMYKKRIWLNDALYYYVVSQNSMSRDHSFEEYLFRSREHCEILLTTLKNIPMDSMERNSYEYMVKEKYILRNSIILIKGNYWRQTFKNIWTSRKDVSVIKHCKRLFFDRP